MPPSARFLTRFAESTRLVAWIVLWSLLTTGSAPVLRAGPPLPIELRISPGRVAHQFGIRSNPPTSPTEPLQPVSSDTLVSDTSTVGGYANILTTWDVQKPFTLSDITAGETLNWSPSTTTSVYDKRDSTWTPTSGNQTKQYFLLPEGRSTENLYLAQNGIWYPVTAASSLYTGSDGITFREAFSTYSSSSTFWLEDYSRYERSPTGKTNLLDAAWTTFSAQRLATVTFYLEAQNLSQTFRFYSRSDGSGVRSVTTRATIANGGASFSIQDPVRGTVQMPAGTVQVTGTVGPRMEFWLTRDGTNNVETPHYIAPAPNGNSPSYSLYGVFPAPNRSLQWTSFIFPNNGGTYSVKHVSGYSAPIRVESTGTRYTYDANGTVNNSVEYATGGAWVDPSVQWNVVEQTTGTTYGAGQKDILGLNPSYRTDAPLPTPHNVTLQIYRAHDHPLTIRQYNDSGTEIVTYSFSPKQWGYGVWSTVNFWNGYTNVPVSVGNYSESYLIYSSQSPPASCTVPIFTVTVPCYTDRPFRIVDEYTGQTAYENFHHWFEAVPDKELQISTSRSGHSLYIERLIGTSDKIQEQQTQGYLSVSSDGGVTFNSYYYFIATAPNWNSTPFRVVDKDTGEKTGWNPTNEDLINWISLPGITGLSGRLTSSNAVELSWPLGQSSRDGAFLVERSTGNGTIPLWHQIAHIPAVDATGSSPALKYTDRLALPGQNNRYRLRYTYGGNLSTPSNYVAITTNPLPATSSAPPDESNPSLVAIKSPHPTIAEFMNPLQGKSVTSTIPGTTQWGGGGIPAFAGYPVVHSGSIMPNSNLWLWGVLERVEIPGSSHLEELIIDPSDPPGNPVLESHTHEAFRVRLELRRPTNANFVAVQEKKDETGAWREVPYTEDPERPGLMYLSKFVDAGHRYFYRIVARNGKGEVLSPERYVDVPARAERSYQQESVPGMSALKRVALRFEHPYTDRMLLRYLLVRFDQPLDYPTSGPRNIVSVYSKSIALAGDVDRMYKEYKTPWLPLEGDEAYPKFVSVVPSCVLFGIDPRSIIADPNGQNEPYCEFLKSIDTGRVLQLYPIDSGATSHAQVMFERRRGDVDICPQGERIKI